MFRKNFEVKHYLAGYLAKLFTNKRENKSWAFGEEGIGQLDNFYADKVLECFTVSCRVGLLSFLCTTRTFSC